MAPKPQKPNFYLVNRDGRYHVYRNDTREGTPTGKSGSSYDEGMEIIGLMEAELRSGSNNSAPRQPKAEKNESVTTPATTSVAEASGTYIAPTAAAPQAVRNLNKVFATKKRATANHLLDASPENVDKAVRLFKFLRELTLLRTKTIRTLERYERVLWLDEVPSEPGCFSLYSIPEDERSELLIEIEQPKFKSVPELPEQLSRWVDSESLNDWKKVPVLKSVAPKAAADEQSEQVQFDRLEEHPEVSVVWDRYLVEQWTPWAEQREKDANVMSWYESIFDIHQNIQKVAENWELLFSIGLLVWKTDSNLQVCRHILTAKATVSFDTARGVLSVSAPAEGLKFQLEQDMLELAERPANHHRGDLQNLLAALNEEPFSQSTLDGFLQSWINAMSARGHYRNEISRPSMDGTHDPVVTFAPAIVFRERTERNMVRLFEEIVESISESGKMPLGIERLIAVVDDGNFTPDGSGGTSGDDEIYFPLQANPDQREIAEKLKYRQGVLVQGPPGTGKSHTIANLVCHLLAQGRRVLVTSHTPRALQVLRDKFPDEMKALCVSVIGDDNIETRKALEESVAGITSKRNNFSESGNRQFISNAKTKLYELRQSEAWTLNALRGIRESDTYNHPTKFGTYKGTTQAIAQRVRAESADFEWFDLDPREEAEPPLTNAEALELLALCRNLSRDRVEQAKKFVPDIESLPAPPVFTEWVEQRKSLSELSAKAADVKTHAAFPASVTLDEERRMSLLGDLGDFLNAYQRILIRREDWVKAAASEVVADRDRSWRRLLELTSSKLDSIKKNMSAGAKSVSGLEDRPLDSVRAHARDLLAHFKAGGGQGFGPFKAKPVKDGQYLLKQTRVDGQLADNVSALESLISWIEQQIEIRALQELWNGIATFKSSNPELLVGELEDSCEPLEQAVQLHDRMVKLREFLALTPGLCEPQWDNVDELQRYAEVLRCGQVEERLQTIESDLQATITILKAAAAHHKAHSVCREMLESLEMLDHELYHSAHRTLAALLKSREMVQRQEALIQKLVSHAPRLVATLQDSCDETVWDSRLAKFEEAWNWARAHAWVLQLSDPKTYSHLSEELETIQTDIRKTLGQLAAARAWHYTFETLTEAEHSHLIAWEMAIKRVGKGTGKYAEKHRRDARKHMDECRSAIPAWIMPLHKVVESTKIGGEPFDVVIVDEASQSACEALLLMYVAKQIVVVGDDKQISPDFVGQNREEVDALRAQFLKGIPFDDALGVDNSFFDQAKIRYRGTIRLKEHFRCMPEIIQFSNNLCYTDDPLIPLRQFGAGRLPPVRTTYIQSGFMNDDTRRPINKPEADAIIEQVKAICADPAYDGKTIGVISLLNTSGQAEYIEKCFKSGLILSKEEMDARKFRVGDAYMFQGDERDIILLSMVVAPKGDQRRLWPLTSDKDLRRFNVAASRARDQVWLFHSVSLADLNDKCVRYKMLQYYQNPNVTMTEIGDNDIESLRSRLQTAYAGAGTPPKPFDSWFEVDVFLRIAERGYRVIPQYEMNGYYIDLLVEGLRGRLAVECDGDTWHGVDRYDYDVLRQRDLERCGMHFWRIRGSAFYLNPDSAMQSLWTTLDRMRIYPDAHSENSRDAVTSASSSGE